MSTKQGYGISFRGVKVTTSLPTKVLVSSRNFAEERESERYGTVLNELRGLSLSLSALIRAEKYFCINLYSFNQDSSKLITKNRYGLQMSLKIGVQGLE